MTKVTFITSGRELFTIANMPDGFTGMLDYGWIKANKVAKPQVGQTWEVEISNTVGHVHFIRPINQIG